MPNAKRAEVRMLNNEIHVSLASFHTIYTKADNYYPTINICGGTQGRNWGGGSWGALDPPW